MSEKRYHLIGWILFVLCSVFYLLDSFRSGNMTLILGGFAFFFGCLAFVIPLVKENQAESLDEKIDRKKKLS